MITKKYTGHYDIGRNILVIGSVHGNELTPSSAIKMFEDTLLEPLLARCASITTLKWVNTSGIIARTREYSEISTTDMNRMFDKNADDSDDLSDTVSKLKNMIVDADVVIDVHSSPNCYPMVLINVDNYSDSYAQFCVDSNIAYAIRYNENPTIKKYAMEMSGIGITVELNGIESVQYQDAANGAVLIKKIIDHISTYKWAPTQKEPTYPVMFEAKTHLSGIVDYTGHVLGGSIFNGSVVGTVTDINDDRSPIPVTYNGPDGRIILMTEGYISPNEPYILVQPHKAK